MRRTFVVGCPRSGTTIVQALLARHPAIFTLPETGFFEELHGDLEWRWRDSRAKSQQRHWRNRVGFARRRVRKIFAGLREQLVAGSRRPLGVPLLRLRLARQFVAMLDRSAQEAGRDMWLEKTPNHLLYIDEIEAQLPDARFVHVVRRGQDVLASLTDAYLRFENDSVFGGGTVHWARRWNRAVEIHGKHIGRPQHHFVFLEDLVQDPEAEWVRLCAFLDLPTEVPVDDACQQTIADLNHEPWKVAAVNGQVRKADQKVDRLYGPQMLRWMQSNLASYDDLRGRWRDSQGRGSAAAAPRLRLAYTSRAARAS
ncbi:sulfotransferase [Dyella solisilvae]|uniref:Sulfotransferase n=1 Tax=Dyella solisilvae TaxID=1920168 RepID=A0A370KD15_9GAMM|nr:sulfotransferase [Dyella solisilvae]RDJ00545.1 sulfotransferase [Dyella solisilvae]